MHGGVSLESMKTVIKECGKMHISCQKLKVQDEET